jgi:hypothetical protein
VIFWETKGNIRPEEFLSWTVGKQSFYIAMLSCKYEDDKEVQKRLKSKVR